MTYPQDPYGQPQDPYGNPKQQPGGYGYGNPGPAPDNYLVWAILTTVLCCLPLGVVSIVKSNAVNGLWMSGQFDEARRSAEAAKKWAMWSAISAVGLWVIGIIAWFLFIAALVASVPDLPSDLTNLPTNFPIPTT
ncbi:hypothetical protein JOF53_002954 [Crossiella equi]|uniref:Interferon-induced transmembrane protein n=1 Tax=Crossiella equi TaxID=130796 RepID=A0ABS5ABX3_9PSEU|nr:CD225/dispanin family protein [Crossiella equi]MBP2474082.1 hypothetical protein [Crossiella equi]